MLTRAACITSNEFAVADTKNLPYRVPQCLCFLKSEKDKTGRG